MHLSDDESDLVHVCNGMVPSGNKQLSETLMTTICDALMRYQIKLGSLSRQTMEFVVVLECVLVWFRLLQYDEWILHLVATLVLQ